LLDFSEVLPATFPWVRLEAEPNLRINAAVVRARTRRAAKTAEVSGAGS
jgi:hypothetical protein